MKVLFIVFVIGLAASPAMACRFCDDLRGLGYTDAHIIQVIRSSASRADAEIKMKQMIAEGSFKKAVYVEARPQQPARQSVSLRQSEPVVAVETSNQAPTVQVATTPQIQAEQIIETSLDDAAVLLAPTDRILSEQKEAAVKTEQLVKRTEFKEKVKKQKLIDAGVTTSAIGTAFIPGVGPYIAGGIILGRTVYGLFQDDFEETQ